MCFNASFVVILLHPLLVILRLSLFVIFKYAFWLFSIVSSVYLFSASIVYSFSVSSVLICFSIASSNCASTANYAFHLLCPLLAPQLRLLFVHSLSIFVFFYCVLWLIFYHVLYFVYDTNNTAFSTLALLRCLLLGFY